MLAILQTCEVQARFPEAIGAGPNGGRNLRARHLHVDVGVGLRRARHFHAIGFHGVDHVVICDLAVHGGLAGDGRCPLDRHVLRDFGSVAGLVGGGHDQCGFGRAIGGRGGNVGGRNRDLPLQAIKNGCDGDGLAVPGGLQCAASFRKASEFHVALGSFFGCDDSCICATDDAQLGGRPVHRELVVGGSRRRAPRSSGGCRNVVLAIGYSTHVDALNDPLALAIGRHGLRGPSADDHLERGVGRRRTRDVHATRLGLVDDIVLGDGVECRGQGWQGAVLHRDGLRGGGAVVACLVMGLHGHIGIDAGLAGRYRGHRIEVHAPFAVGDGARFRYTVPGHGHRIGILGAGRRIAREGDLAGLGLFSADGGVATVGLDVGGLTRGRLVEGDLVRGGDRVCAPWLRGDCRHVVAAVGHAGQVRQLGSPAAIRVGGDVRNRGISQLDMDDRARVGNAGHRHGPLSLGSVDDVIAGNRADDGLAQRKQRPLQRHVLGGNGAVVAGLVLQHHVEGSVGAVPLAGHGQIAFLEFHLPAAVGAHRGGLRLAPTDGDRHLGAGFARAAQAHAVLGFEAGDGGVVAFQLQVGSRCGRCLVQRELGLAGGGVALGVGGGD